jgi:hypothetical protein
MAGIFLGEAARKKLACGGQSVQLQRKFGTLIPHAAYLWDQAARAHLN